MRSSPILLLFASACGSAPDARPATFDVVTLEVLAPSCGEIQCHSSATNSHGIALDTLANARTAMTAGGLLQTGRNGGSTELFEVLTASGHDRMPPDYPLADEDLALIESWLAQNTPGL